MTIFILDLFKGNLIWGILTLFSRMLSRLLTVQPLTMNLASITYFPSSRSLTLISTGVADIGSIRLISLISSLLGSGVPLLQSIKVQGQAKNLLLSNILRYNGKVLISDSK